MIDDLRNRVARAIANVREGGWPADTYALLQQHYLTMADAALAEMGGVRVKTRQDYDPKKLNALLDYIERVEKTEHGMDGAVREIARRAAALRGPTFRSVRVLAAIEPAPVSVREAARVLLGHTPKITAKPLAEMSEAMKIDAHPAILLRGFCAALRAIAEGKDDE